MNKKAFTLVELIVVITILAVLWTIWFISLQWFASNARDSARTSDLNTIAKSLDFYKISSGRFPDPTDPINITFSGSLVWQQWTFWDDTRRVSQRISEVPTDPLTQTPYTYSVTNNGQEYQLWSLSESTVAFSPVISSTYANNGFFVKHKWNYNGKIASVRQWENIYILWVPTILTTATWSTTLNDIILEDRFSLKNSQNLPAWYIGSLPNDVSHTWATNFVPWNDTFWDPVVFSWLESTLANDGIKADFWENLLNYYESTDLINTQEYLGLASSAEWWEARYVNALITWEFWWLSSHYISDSLTLNISSPSLPSYPSDTFVGIWDTQWDTSFVIPITFGSWDAVDIIFENTSDSSQTWALLWQSSDYITVTVPIPGQYRILITWEAKGFAFSNQASRQPEKFISLEQWWELTLNTINSAFYGAVNLEGVPNNTDWLELIVNMWSLFRNTNFNGDISQWDTSGVNDMNGMFFGNTTFDRDISWWDISWVTSVQNMFRNATAFNQDLSSWSADWDLVVNCTSFDNNATSWSSWKPTFTNCSY